LLAYRFNLFREIWAQSNPGIASATPPAANDLDAVLHFPCFPSTQKATNREFSIGAAIIELCA
jgi:hypothetical protein